MGPPPSDEVKVITMRAIGGEVGAAATLAPKVMGLQRIQPSTSVSQSVFLLMFRLVLLGFHRRKLGKIFETPP